ncbi:DUF397 domain-containing protein [Nocardia sp. NPDC050412]|uniref:DUF397 domain-containing protein n=1 Tax=Nocardia sp. NPDC050412 TaxID=3364320 RepID=UPI0037A2B484
MNIDLPEAKWFKSSHSTGNDTCMEIAHLGEGRGGVRDPKNPTGPALVSPLLSGTPSLLASKAASSIGLRSDEPRSKKREHQLVRGQMVLEQPQRQW